MSRHARKSVADKSPLHQSALRLKDLTPGRTIIWFRCDYGQRDTFRVLARPHVELDELGERTLAVRLLSLDFGTVETPYLDIMGVVPYFYNGQWDDLSFMIDARKAHLLPELMLGEGVILDDYFDPYEEYEYGYMLP